MIPQQQQQEQQHRIPKAITNTLFPRTEAACFRDDETFTAIFSKRHVLKVGNLFVVKWICGFCLNKAAIGASCGVALWWSLSLSLWL